MINKVLTEPVYDDDAVNKKYVDERLKDISVFYPIGSIYMNVSPINPNEIFSFGVWERIEDVFLLSAGSKYEAGSTGGEAEHQLTVDELPLHDHKIWQKNSNGYENGGRVVMDSATYSYPAYYSTVNYAVSKTGGDLPHNNMPPYLTVYMWKRIA